MIFPTSRYRGFCICVSSVSYTHLIPELGFSSVDMDNDSLYKTDYVIWDSRNAAPLSEMLEAGNEDEAFAGVSLTSYQLYAYVCRNIGLNMSSFGNVAKAEAYLVQNENYFEILRLLEYDTLYGVCLLYTSRCV